MQAAVWCLTELSMLFKPDISAYTSYLDVVVGWTICTNFLLKFIISGIDNAFQYSGLKKTSICYEAFLSLLMGFCGQKTSLDAISVEHIQILRRHILRGNKENGCLVPLQQTSDLTMRNTAVQTCPPLMHSY